jgi:hypothetical protein
MILYLELLDIAAAAAGGLGGRDDSRNTLANTRHNLWG